MKAAVHSGVIPLGNPAGFTFLPAMQLEVITELGITALPSRNGRHDGRRPSSSRRAAPGTAQRKRCLPCMGVTMSDFCSVQNMTFMFWTEQQRRKKNWSTARTIPVLYGTVWQFHSREVRSLALLRRSQ